MARDGQVAITGEALQVDQHTRDLAEERCSICSVEVLQMMIDEINRARRRVAELKLRAQRLGA